MCESCGCGAPEIRRALSKVERVKSESDFLRGTLIPELGDDSSNFSDDAYQLLKFHGIYQQDDRDLRQQRKREGKDRAWSLMVRLKIPAGILTADQYLACDEAASRYGNGTLRVTTRQDFQFHGILKRELRLSLRSLNEALITTLGACGDVERNVTCCPAPLDDSNRPRLQAYAHAISDHLLPRTSAYHEVWLDGDKVFSNEPDTEPIYGEQYLPRKFKTGIALPDDNCIDVYTQDIGIVADVEEGALQGFNLLVGGGLGMTHNNAATYPRLATPIAYLPLDRLLEAVEGVVRIQRDHGDRSERKHARLKYLLDDWGEERFVQELKSRVGFTLESPRDLGPADVDDHLGWQPQGDDTCFLGVHIENGRIQDDAPASTRTAFRRLVEQFRPGVRLTPQQNILFTDLPSDARPEVEQLLRNHGVALAAQLSNTLRYAMACPALPTCGLAVAESERVLPAVIRELESEIAGLGLVDERISVRMTGCPNGCTRPYVGDIGFVGRTLDRYVIFLGGDFEGTLLNEPFADMVPTEQLVPTVLPVLEYYRRHRTQDEPFGRFCRRVGVGHLQEMFAPPLNQNRRSGES